MKVKNVDELVGSTPSMGFTVSSKAREGWSTGYLALTDSELVVLKTRPGLANLKATAEVKRTPLSGVTGAEMDDGKTTAALTIQTAEGPWTFDVPRANFKHARKLLEKL